MIAEDQPAGFEDLLLTISEGEVVHLTPLIEYDENGTDHNFARDENDAVKVVITNIKPSKNNASLEITFKLVEAHEVIKYGEHTLSFHAGVNFLESMDLPDEIFDLPS